MKGKTLVGLLFVLLALTMMPLVNARTVEQDTFVITITGDIQLGPVTFVDEVSGWNEDLSTVRARFARFVWHGECEYPGGTDVFNSGMDLDGWYNGYPIRTYFGHMYDWYSREQRCSDDSWWLFLFWDYDVDEDGVIERTDVYSEFLSLTGTTSHDNTPEGIYDEDTRTWTVGFTNCCFSLDACKENCVILGKSRKCEVTCTDVGQYLLKFTMTITRIG